MAPDGKQGSHPYERRDTSLHSGRYGGLIFKDGQWHLFACIFPKGKQFVTHYISRDGSLDHWDYVKEDTFGPDGVIYQGPDWRDPRIVYREELGEYWMFLAASANEGHSQTGCVGLCVSRDLKHWEYRKPVYYPRRHRQKRSFSRTGFPTVSFP